MGKIALEEHVVRYRQEHTDRWHTTGTEEDQACLVTSTSSSVGTPTGRGSRR